MKIVAGTAGIPVEPVLHKVGNPKRGILCVVVKIQINQNKIDNLCEASSMYVSYFVRQQHYHKSVSHEASSLCETASLHSDSQNTQPIKVLIL